MRLPGRSPSSSRRSSVDYSKTVQWAMGPLHKVRLEGHEEIAVGAIDDQVPQLAETINKERLVMTRICEREPARVTDPAPTGHLRHNHRPHRALRRLAAF